MPTIYKIEYKCPRCGEVMYTGGTGSDTRQFGPATITCKTCSSTIDTTWHQWKDGTKGQKIGWFVYQFFDTMIRGWLFGVFLGILFLMLFSSDKPNWMWLLAGPLVLWGLFYVRAIYKVTHDLL